MPLALPLNLKLKVFTLSTDMTAIHKGLTRLMVFIDVYADLTEGVKCRAMASEKAKTQNTFRVK